MRQKLMDKVEKLLRKYPELRYDKEVTTCKTV